MSLRFLYHGTTPDRWAAIQKEGVFRPASRIGLFSDRHAPAEQLRLPSFLDGLEVPAFALRTYSCFIHAPETGERFYLALPADASYDPVRRFLRRFIEKRRLVALEADCPPASEMYVMDFAALFPFFMGTRPPIDAFRAYLATFVPFERYVPGTYAAPEILVACPIPASRIRCIFRPSLDRFFERLDRGEMVALPPPGIIF